MDIKKLSQITDAQPVVNDAEKDLREAYNHTCDYIGNVLTRYARIDINSDRNPDGMWTLKLRVYSVDEWSVYIYNKKLTSSPVALEFEEGKLYIGSITSMGSFSPVDQPEIASYYATAGLLCRYFDEISNSIMREMSEYAQIRADLGY